MFLGRTLIQGTLYQFWNGSKTHNVGKPHVHAQYPLAARGRLPLVQVTPAKLTTVKSLPDACIAASSIWHCQQCCCKCTDISHVSCSRVEKTISYVATNIYKYIYTHWLWHVNLFDAVLHLIYKTVMWYIYIYTYIKHNAIKTNQWNTDTKHNQTHGFATLWCDNKMKPSAQRSSLNL